MADKENRNIGLCITCLDTKPERSYSLLGVKCRREDVNTKLSGLCGTDLDLSQDTIICKPCFNKLNKCVQFITTAKQSIASYNSKGCSEKRCLNSPSHVSSSSDGPQATSTPRRPRKLARRALEPLSG